LNLVLKLEDVRAKGETEGDFTLTNAAKEEIALAA
jgi:hypothetical protein